MTDKTDTNQVKKFYNKDRSKLLVVFDDEIIEYGFFTPGDRSTRYYETTYYLDDSEEDKLHDMLEVGATQVVEDMIMKGESK